MGRKTSQVAPERTAQCFESGAQVAAQAPSRREAPTCRQAGDAHRPHRSCTAAITLSTTSAKGLEASMIVAP
jgi:hypothetical protein